MRLSQSEIREFNNYAQDIFRLQQFHEMKYYLQHGNTSTFLHCMVVAYYSYLLSLRLPVQFDNRSIVRGALLHDFYLYDWHIPDGRHKLHGFVHPGFALTNAKKYFKLNQIESDIIAKHMWPLTVTKYPKYKEALLVCLVDKYCSLAETLHISILPEEYKQYCLTIITKHE
ncbi:MAG TPA: phosphohydrolase [Mobilitalea sp.]|nr:phosphohydrolase [Mobilitalea sp.]